MAPQRPDRTAAAAAPQHRSYAALPLPVSKAIPIKRPPAPTDAGVQLDTPNGVLATQRLRANAATSREDPKSANGLTFSSTVSNGIRAAYDLPGTGRTSASNGASQSAVDLKDSTAFPALSSQTGAIQYDRLKRAVSASRSSKTASPSVASAPPSIPLYPPGLLPPGLTAPTNGVRHVSPTLTASSRTLVGSPAPTTSDLDRFAPVYVPQWKLDVNAATPTKIFKAKASKQNVLSFAADLLPQGMAQKLAKDEEKIQKEILADMQVPNRKMEKLATSDHPPESAYATKLLMMQYAEHSARKADLKTANLYSVPLTLVKDADGLFTLEHDSLRENYPLLEMNDVIYMRRIRDEDQMSQFFERPDWDGNEYIGIVHAVRRAAGQVTIRCEPLAEELAVPLSLPVNVKHTLGNRFNIRFQPQDRPFYLSHAAVLYLHAQLQREEMYAVGSSLAQSWLFPSALHAENAALAPGLSPNPQGPVALTFVDRDLNAEQRLAVVSIAATRRQIPFLCSGPPGTGKTKTLCEAVLQILQVYSDAHILLCGASNSSADTLAQRLMPHLGVNEMLRLNDSSRNIDDVRRAVVPFCNIKDGEFELPDIARLVAYKVIVCSVTDAGLLWAARVTNTTMAMLQDKYNPILAAADGSPSKPKSYHFDYCMIDEAGQATEPEIACSLAVTLPDRSLLEDPNQTRRIPQLVLCGDTAQLGPLISSNSARSCELDVSLLQRLFERRVYAEHPKARRNMAKVSKSLLDTGTTATDTLGSYDTSVPFANLVRNYRSHPSLLMVPSSLFYNDTLIPCAPPEVQRTVMTKWKCLGESRIPLLVKHVDGQEDSYHDVGWFNAAEIEAVVAVVTDLVLSNNATHGSVVPRDIAVISPFREQIWRIRIALRKLDFGEANVGTEFDLQGNEARIVIISTVRTSLRFIQQDKTRNRGILFEAKRFNVAVTRSKELLVILGHMPTLSEDPYWRSLLRFSKRHSAYQGPDFNLTKHDDHINEGISQLEEMLLNDTTHDDSAGLAIVNSVARMALSDFL